MCTICRHYSNSLVSHRTSLLELRVDAKYLDMQQMYNKFLKNKVYIDAAVEDTSGENTSTDHTFLKAMMPIIFPLKMVGIQPMISEKTIFSSRKMSLVRWWNVLALMYLHGLIVKAVAGLILTNGGLEFWIQLTTLLRSCAATISADIYVYKQKDVQVLFRRMSHVYEKFKEDERRGFRKRTKMAAVFGWLFLTAYFVVTAVSVYNMGQENFLGVHFFMMKIPNIPLVAQFVLAYLFLLVQQLVMWGTLSFMIVMYVSLCNIIKLSFRYLK